MDIEDTQSRLDATLMRRVLAHFPHNSINVFNRDQRNVLAPGHGLIDETQVADPLVGRLLADDVVAEVAPLADAHLRRAFAGEVVIFDHVVGPRTYEIHAAPFDVDREDVATIVTVATDVTAARVEMARLRILVEATEVLIASLDIDATLAGIAHLVVPRLADWCVVHLVGDDGEIERVVITHADPGSEALARELVEGYRFNRDAAAGAARVLRTGESELIRVVPDELLAAAAVDANHLALLRGVGLVSSIIVPMASHGRVVGAITLAVAGARRPYSDEDLALAEALARRATLAVDNARQYRLAQEEIARQRHAAEGDQLRQVALDRLAASDVIGIASADGEEIVEANDAFLRMVGYTAADVNARRLNWRTLTPPEFHALDDHAIEELATTGSCIPYEKEYLRRDGSRIPILIGATLLNSQSRRWVCFAVDLSARHALEEARQAAMAEAEHDLLSPVSVARWQAQLLRRHPGNAPLDDETLNQGLEIIEDATTRLRAMINDLMDLARMQLGRALKLSLEPTDLVTLAERSADEHRRFADRHTIEVQTSEPALTGCWDTAQMERVLDNLLSNAMKFSPRGGVVALSVARERALDGDWVVLTVRDEGIGIPAADLPNVFGAFVRGSSVTGQMAGFGLGLASVKQIVEAHGGTVGVESREGNGCVFTVRLPMTLPTSACRTSAS